MGLGFAFTHQINPVDAVKVLRAYRRDFQPSPHFSAPYSILTTMAACGETDAAVARLKSSSRLVALASHKACVTFHFRPSQKQSATR